MKAGTVCAGESGEAADREVRGAEDIDGGGAAAAANTLVTAATSVTGAMYVTIALDDDSGKADARLNSFLERYYLQPAAVIRTRQAYYAGSATGVAEYLEAYARAGTAHFCIRFAGEHEAHMTALAKVRSTLGW